MQPFIVFMQAITSVGLALGGFFTEQALWLTAAATPALILGTLLGLRAYRGAAGAGISRLSCSGCCWYRVSRCWSDRRKQGAMTLMTKPGSRRGAQTQRRCASSPRRSRKPPSCSTSAPARSCPTTSRRASRGSTVPRRTARRRPSSRTMIENIGVAERLDNLLCQDTGIPIFNVLVGRNVQVDGWALKQAIARGTARATREHPLRSSVVHPITRKNEHTSCGERVPVINIDFTDVERRTAARDDPEGLGFRERLLPADADPRRWRRRGEALRGRPRHPGRRQGLPADHRGRRRRRHLGSVHAPREGRRDPRRWARAAPIPRARSWRRRCRKR